MQLNKTPLNLPTLEQAIDRQTLTVSPNMPLREVLHWVSQQADNQRIANSILNDEFGLPARGMGARLVDLPQHKCCVVVVESNQILGIVTEQELVHAIASGKTLQQDLTISEVMVQPVVTLTLSDAQDIFTPLLYFRQHQIRYLPVMSRKGELLGTITPTSILQAVSPINFIRLGTVEEVMDTRLVWASATVSILTIAQLMADHRASCALIYQPSAETDRTGACNSESISQTFLPLPLENANVQPLPVGIITEQKLVQTLLSGLDLAHISALSIAGRLVNNLKPDDSLFRAYEQMRSQQVQTLLVSEETDRSVTPILGLVTPAGLLRSLQPTQIYQKLKRSQHSAHQLALEKAELLRSRNVELEHLVEQRTAELQQVLSQVERQVQSAALINEIVQAMRGTLILEEILQTTVNKLHTALQVSRCIIFRPEPDSQLAASHVSEATQAGESLIGIHCDFYQVYHLTLARGEPLILSHTHHLSAELQASAFQCGIRSILILPLIYQDTYMGGISLHQVDRERKWTREEVDVVKAIADHCAIAIHQSELYQQLQVELEERQRLCKALETSEELFCQVVENIHQVFFVRDCIENKVLYVSPAYEQIWGCSSKNLSRWPEGLLETIHPDDRDSMTRAIETATEAKSYNHEYRIVRPDGEIRWVWVRAFPLSNERGQAYRITGIIEDITVRKQTEMALREQQEFLRTVLDSNPSLIYVKDREGRFTLANQALAEVYGTTPEDLIGKTDADFNPDRTQVEQLLIADREVMTTLQPKLITEEFVTSHAGESRYFQTAKKPLLSTDGQAYHVLGVTTDITDRKLAEIALQETNEQLQAVLDAVPGFVSWVNADGRYLGVNRRLAESYQIPAEAFMGQRLGFLNGSPEYIEFLYEFLAESDPTASKVIEFYSQDRQQCYLLATQKYQQGMAAVTVGIDITDRKRAEEALRENQRVFQAIFNNTFQFTGLLTPDGIVQQVNQSLLDFGGLPASEAIGYPLWETPWWKISPDTQQQLQDAIAKAATGEFVRYDVDILGADRRIATIDFSLKPVFDETERVVLLIPEGRDITELKRAQAERDRFFNYATDLMAIADFSGNIRLVNSAWEDLLGFTKAELEGKHYSDFLHPDDLQTTLSIWETQAVNGETINGLENRYRCQDGSYKWLSWNMVLFPAEGLTYAFARDITAAKQAEIALRASESLFRSLSESSPVGIFMADANGQCIYTNPRCQMICGFTFEESLGKGWTHFIHPDDRDEVSTTWSVTAQAGQETFQEYRFQQKDLSIRWVQGRSVPLFSGEHQLIGHIGTIQDITESKEAEVKLLASLLEKEVLLKEVHHRVKNNLQVITSLLDLQSQRITDPKTWEIFLSSQNRIKSMALIHERLYHSDSLAQIEFADYVHSLASYLLQAYTINADKIALKVSCEAVFLNIDTAIPCGLIVNELTVNAFKHAFPDDLQGQIWIDFRQLNNSLFQLIVQDDGIKNINLSDSQYANSLGLKIVRSLVRQLEGEMIIDNSQGMKIQITFKELG